MTMMISIDSGNPDEIKQVKNWGFEIDKITSNPTSVSATIQRKGGSVYDTIMDIRDAAGRGIPISVEALGTGSYEVDDLNRDHFVREAAVVDGWGKDFVVKLPATHEGFHAAQEIDFMPINFTLVFSQHQAYLTGDFGGAYTSPFVGRYDDKTNSLGIDRSGMELVDEIARNFRSFEFATKILTASVRHTDHIEKSALVGSQAITIPFAVFKMLHESGKTDWLNKLRKDTQIFEPKKPRQPSFSGKFEPSKMRDFERELLDDGLVKFLADAKKAKYSII